VARQELRIMVDCDEEDFDWLRNKCVAAVESAVDENLDRLDHPEGVGVTWEQHDA